MRRYIKPELEIKKFEIEDVILLSSVGTSSISIPDIDGGTVTYLEEWIKSWTESE